jgi:hypothetical protein
MEKRRLRIAVSGLELWKRGPSVMGERFDRGRTFHSINSNVPSLAFISSEFSISGSLPTSSNRLSRQAHCSVYPPLSNSVPRSSRFSGGSTTPPICKPKSAIEERNKAPAYFRMATLRLSFLFVYIANRITAPFHFTGASQESDWLADRLDV